VKKYVIKRKYYNKNIHVIQKESNTGEIYILELKIYQK
jgi:hypothetical protein